MNWTGCEEFAGFSVENNGNGPEFRLFECPLPIEKQDYSRSSRSNVRRAVCLSLTGKQQFATGRDKVL